MTQSPCWFWGDFADLGITIRMTQTVKSLGNTQDTKSKNPWTKRRRNKVKLDLHNILSENIVENSTNFEKEIDI